MSPFTTCLACGGTIRERADDIALSHTSKPLAVMFFHDREECQAIARGMRKVRGVNEWSLTFRACQWDPHEAEGLVR